MTRFPDGSISSEQRLEAATVRALDAYLSIERKADRLYDEICQATPPMAVPASSDEDDDSLVVAIREIARTRDS